MYEETPGLVCSTISRTIDKDAPGRIHQDDHFDVAGFDGETLECLVGIGDKDDPDDHPILIYLKTTNKTWQKFFLDAYLGFWEDWGDIEQEDGGKSIDYGAMFTLTGKTIKNIKCRDRKIVIEFANGDQFILKHINREDDDTECEVVFKQQSA